MSIIVLQTTDQAAGFEAAQKLRTEAIEQGSSALILADVHLDDPVNHEPQHLLEKIIDAFPCIPGQPAGAVHWKPGARIVIVGEGNLDRALASLDEICPGIVTQLGPVQTLDAASIG